MKYRNRLKPANQNRVKQLLSVLKALIDYLKKTPNTSNKGSSMESKIVCINDFMCALMIDNINLFEVEEFIQKSELTKKVCIHITIHIN